MLLTVCCVWLLNDETRIWIELIPLDDRFVIWSLILFNSFATEYNVWPIVFWFPLASLCKTALLVFDGSSINSSISFESDTTDTNDILNSVIQSNVSRTAPTINRKDVWSSPVGNRSWIVELGEKASKTRWVEFDVQPEKHKREISTL